MSTSRLSQGRQAVRTALPGRVMLSGPSGAGKTLTALHIAESLAPGGRHLVIDTERGEALCYAPNPRDPDSEHTIPFTHVDWKPPYDPSEFVATMREASGQFDTTITDSFTHFWAKEGGILDIADGRFTNWKQARPLQEQMIEAMKEHRGHVILCVRSKIEYVQEAVQDGNKTKQVVRKVGMAPQQDPTLEYEVNVALDIDLSHKMYVTKSRCTAVPVGRTYGPGWDEVAKFSGEYGKWLEGGVPVLSPEEISELQRQIVQTLTPEQTQWAKEEWRLRGLPNILMLTEDDRPAVLSLIKEAGEVAR